MEAIISQLVDPTHQLAAELSYGESFPADPFGGDSTPRSKPIDGRADL
jgi:hypothetical protein